MGILLGTIRTRSDDGLKVKPTGDNMVSTPGWLLQAEVMCEQDCVPSKRLREDSIPFNFPESTAIPLPFVMFKASDIKSLSEHYSVAIFPA